VKLPKPKNTMEDGETREVESMSGGSALPHFIIVIII
jgi:hypothetical protein